MIIEVNGVSLYVEDHGEGTPALLVRGWPDSARLWRHQIWYQMFFQFGGIAEATLQYQDWAWLRRFSRGTPLTEVNPATFVPAALRVRSAARRLTRWLES